MSDTVYTFGGERMYPESEVSALRAENERLREALLLALDRCERCGGYKPEFWCDECRLARAALALAPKEDNGE
jgi:hypothetical protein